MFLTIRLVLSPAEIHCDGDSDSTRPDPDGRRCSRHVPSLTALLDGALQHATVQDLAYSQRALGAIVGSAVGDALGAPFEFGPPGQYSRDFRGRCVGGTGEMIGGGGFGWAPGEFTDDTQMAIVQAESVLACGGVDGADLFERFGIWAAARKDVGVQTRAVLGSGRPWDEAAAELLSAQPAQQRRQRFADAGDADRGATSPRRQRTRRLLRPTRPRSSPTVIRRPGGARRSTTHDPRRPAWRRSVRGARRGAGRPARRSGALSRDARPETGSRRTATAERNRVDVSRAGGVGGAHDDTFADAVTAAIDLGGDTDTVAAVTGGLAGAMHGIQGIPSRWMTYLARTRHHSRRATHVPRSRSAGSDVAAPRRAGGAGDAARRAAEGRRRSRPGSSPRISARPPMRRRDWAVLSLCRVGDRFGNHSGPARGVPHRQGRRPQPRARRGRRATASSTIDAWRAEGRTVVVHCHGGASRTGLVLRAWLMRHHGWDAATATAFVRERWPALDEWNGTFTNFLNGWRP